MNLLITGGLGHIGSYFLENINKFYNIKNIYVVDANYSNNLNILFQNNIKKKLNFFLSDIMDFDFDNKIAKIDYILHLASHTNAERSLKNKNYYYKNNFNIFKKICLVAKKYNSKLIHVSSTSVYGKSSGTVAENCKKNELKPQSPYAEIKLKEEEYLNKTNIEYITLRFGTISGVSAGIRFHTAVNKFCLNAALNLEIPVWKTALNQLRPYLSVNDALRVVLFIIKKNIFDRQVYNILSANLTVKNILNLINKNSKKKIKIKMVNSKIMNQLSYKVSRKKIEKKGFSFKSLISNDIKNTLKILENIKK